MQAIIAKRNSPRGAARRLLLAHKALELLGESGLHALTHRAVDTALDLPAGSCSFYYGTRLALVLAAADRLSELDRIDLLSVQEPSGRFDVLALMRRWTGAESRKMLLARLELYLTSTRHPGVHERTIRNRSFFLETTAAVLAAKGIEDVSRAASQLLSLVDGELLRVAMFCSVAEPYEPSAPFSRELSRYRETD